MPPPIEGPFTGIGVAPRVASAAAVTRSTVRVYFSESMITSGALVAPGSYVLTPDGGSDARTVTGVAVESPQRVLLTLDGLLTLGTDNYLVEVTGPTDLAGNALDPAHDMADFGFLNSPSEPVLDLGLEPIGLLNPERYYSAWGVGWGNFGASDDARHGVDSEVNHVVRGRRRLIAQYQENSQQSRPIINGLVELECSRVQTVEDIAVTLRDQRGLDTSWGFLLDLVGERVGMARGGLEDNTYRIRLAGQILANASRGTPEEIRGVLDILMQGLFNVRIIAAPPATILLRTAELLQPDGEAFARIVRAALPIGVRAIVEWELPARMGRSFGFEADNTAGPWAEYAEDSSAAGLWAEASDGGD